MEFQEFSKRAANVDYSKLSAMANICRGDILTMTTLAGSGHPGGSMSTIDCMLSLYSIANISKDNLDDNSRDRIFVSHGHISPAVYSCLNKYGILPDHDYIAYFRKAGSMYEGHIERTTKGVEWTTGNLGQGLSAGCGAAVAGLVNNQDFDVYVFMGDGEQEKGQITESRRFAVKYGLKNIIVIIDYNRLQISGNINKVMPSMDIAKSYKADGWEVITINGHDYNDIIGAFVKAKACDKPVCILAETVMGKGVSFMENKEGYHGAPLNEEKYYEAMKELNIEPKLEKYKAMRKGFQAIPHKFPVLNVNVNTGNRIIYDKDVKTDNRSAFGAALKDIVSINHKTGNTEVIVFDCDLAGSVKTADVEKNIPSNFFQSGISEHHTAVCAGSASVNGVVSFFADFGMFGVDEVYNQQRLNEINGSNLKVVTTHVGVDVGEDGKTHMCIDYIGLMRNVFGFKVIVPADPNEVDTVIRYVAKEQGNFLIAMGRSKLPVILDQKGSVFFDDNYEFEYGKLIPLRYGGDYAILSYGSTTYRALEVSEVLKKDNINISVIHVPSPAFIDDNSFKSLAKYKQLFIYEDHISSTGLYGTIANKSLDMGISIKAKPFGVNEFPCSGNADEVYDILGLSPNKIASAIKVEVLK